MKRILALATILCLLLCAAGASASVPQQEDGALYEIRQKSSSGAARIMRVGREYYRTTINYISLRSPISIRIVDASPSGKGDAVEVAYTTSNKGSQTRQYLLNCRGLQLTSQYWPMIAVEGSYDLSLLINGGTVENMRIDGGEITFEDATITGVIELRGENTSVDFVNCVFEDGAKVHTSPTVTVMENGVVVE